MHGAGAILALLIFGAARMPIGAGGWFQNSTQGQDPDTFEATGGDAIAPQTKPRSARELLERYMAANEAFDASVADLYSDDAKIKATRIYPNGTTRALTMEASQWKAMIRELMPVAKARGDRDSFSKVTFTDEGGRVRIRATRHSGSKDYDSPWSMLVGPNADGNWVIFEEVIETQP
jgi:hypothetical protein